MKKIVCPLFVCIFIVLPNLIFAQSDQILSMKVEQTPIANYYALDSLPVLTDSTVFDVGLQVNLFDTTNIQSIDVEIGSVDGSSDLFSHSYAFDVSGSLGSGLSYQREAYSITLGAGSITNMIYYYSRVRLHFADGSFSPYVVYNR